jgi:hypothetical protein
LLFYTAIHDSLLPLEHNRTSRSKQLFKSLPQDTVMVPHRGIHLQQSNILYMVYVKNNKVTIHKIIWKHFILLKWKPAWSSCKKEIIFSGTIRSQIGLTNLYDIHVVYIQFCLNENCPFKGMIRFCIYV